MMVCLRCFVGRRDAQSNSEFLGPLSQWPDSIPMLSDLNDVYEPGESAQAAFDAKHPVFDAFWVAPCPPPVQQLSESRYDDHFNSPSEYFPPRNL
jgi:hypothetical protein